MTADLDPANLIAEEFEYIARSAFQANEDRAKVTTLYLLTVGSFLAAMFSLRADSFGGQGGYVAFAGIFIILSIYAALTLLQLIRLRQAWYDSAQAMNQIIEYFIAQAAAPSLVEAFAWTQKTLPPKFKPWSISFLLALQVILLGAASLGGAVVFLSLALAGDMRTWMWLIAVFVALIYAADMIAVYWWVLREDRR